MRLFTQNKKNGFTLVETLVAISILSLSILSTFTAVQNSLQSSSLSKDQVTAFYLVQEAVEYMRNVRDTNAIQAIGTPGYNWLTRIVVMPDQTSSGPCDFGKRCTLDVAADNLATCTRNGSSCPVLRQDTISNLYGYNSAWIQSRFTRQISLRQISPDEVVIQVTISWVTGKYPKTFTVEQTLFNWR